MNGEYNRHDLRDRRFYIAVYSPRFLHRMKRLGMAQTPSVVQNKVSLYYNFDCCS